MADEQATILVVEDDVLVLATLQNVASSRLYGNRGDERERSDQTAPPVQFHH
jgi:hypothetical protein